MIFISKKGITKIFFSDFDPFNGLCSYNNCIVWIYIQILEHMTRPNSYFIVLETNILVDIGMEKLTWYIHDIAEHFLEIAH